ncbi:MAG: hypothetical protein AAFQ02_11850 [Bacteroidota bacterium]
MSYSTKKKYVSRRERARRISKGTRMTMLFVIIAVTILMVQNRVAIFNHLKTFFY